MVLELGLELVRVRLGLEFKDYCLGLVRVRVKA